MCAWCGTTISGPGEGPVDSHGICQACNEVEIEKARQAAALRRVRGDKGAKHENGSRRAPRRLEILRTELAAAAQRVYDDWIQDAEGHDEGRGYGGICHEIADAFSEVLYSHGINSTGFHFTIDENHVTAVADIDGDGWRVDVLPWVYETGSAYTWKKISGVVFEPEDILIEPMGYPFKEYLDPGDEQLEENPLANRPDRGWWKAVHPYVSPRERALDPHEAWVRAIAYGIKHGDDSAIRTAAAEMAPFVPCASWVIPAPSSRAWQYGGVRKLAELLAQITGGTYAEPIARARTVESSHQRRQSGGRGLTAEEHLASMESRMRGPCPEKTPVVVIDNVVTTGATLDAVRRLLGPGCDVRAVVWAEAQEPTA